MRLMDSGGSFNKKIQKTSGITQLNLIYIKIHLNNQIIKYGETL